MTTIFIIGTPSDRTLEHLIRSVLSRTYSVTYIRGSSFSQQGQGYELICFDCEAPLITGTSAPIVIAKNNSPLPDKLPPDCTAIFSAEDERQLAAVRKNGVFAVDCGFSPRSTVSFSGSSDSTLVISLNRSLTALSGRSIQPLELPVSRQADPYSLMSFTALRLLLDDFDSELGELM